MINYNLYLATDREMLGRRDLAEVVEEAIRNGVTVVQLREKHVSGRDFFGTGQRLLAVTRRYGVPLIINDRIDIMLALEADGVHIGRQDFPLPEARRMTRGRILGYSVNCLEHLLDAEAAGVDYVGVGPVFATGTKQDTGPVLGLEGLGRIVARAHLPCVAIGGIGEDNIASVARAGVVGCCVISAILAAHDGAAAARHLRQAFDENRIVGVPSAAGTAPGAVSGQNFWI